MRKEKLSLKYGALALILSWKIIFFFIPLCNLMKEGFRNIQFVLFIRFFNKSNLLTIFIRSVSTAAFVALISLIIGYSVSYIIFKKSSFVQNFLLLALSAPFLTNFIVHLAAWSEFLSHNGFLHQFLNYIGINSNNYSFLYSSESVLLGFIYCYLPFMIFPLLHALEKFDKTLLQASYDLGASKVQTVFRVLIPETKSAILTGFFLVFIPASCEFVIPEILGGDRLHYYGSVIYNLVLTPSLMPHASLAILFFVLLLLIVGYFLYQFIQKVIFLLEKV
jgi:ABC-type spermidine/putrescine transport system permease subunit I